MQIEFFGEKTIPIQENETILEASLNANIRPVRAGIVEHAEDYLYSSARFYYNKKCLIELTGK
jgi:hypothetical protein